MVPNLPNLPGSCHLKLTYPSYPPPELTYLAIQGELPNMGSDSSHLTYLP
jgi:hypothetical protein